MYKELAVGKGGGGLHLKRTLQQLQKQLWWGLLLAWRYPHWLWTQQVLTQEEACAPWMEPALPPPSH